jgi:histidinol-phosphate aminotransferase
MSKSTAVFRKDISSKSLSRPNWINQDHRSHHKIWLDKNECADPEMNKIVIQSLSKITPESVFSYPELDTLYGKIAKFSNVLPENILLTAGSDGAIRACFESCIQPGDSIIASQPTFAMYEVYSKVYGAKVTWLDYEKSDNGPLLEVDRVVNAIKKIRPKMVCLPNPDSPTGTVFSNLDLRKIVDTASDVGALMLIDEAYHPLYKETSVPWIHECNHLVVVRSFSKAWSAAGLRVGYAIANKELTAMLHKQRPMYEIGNVSAKAIEILLDHEKDMLQSVVKINAGKNYFQDAMKGLGLSTYESHGNFLHVRFGRYAYEIHKILENKVYYRKDFNEPCLQGYSRFSSTTIDRFKPIVKFITDVVLDYKKQESSNNESL